MTVPKSLKHDVQTPPAGSVLRSGTFTRTELAAVDDPFFAKKAMPTYLEAL